MIIDMHTHILPNVDDGCTSLESALELVFELNKSGVTKIIVTPHYQTGVYENSNSFLRQEFEKLKNAVNEKFSDITLYLGEEIYCDRDVYKKLQSGELLTLNNSKCVLIEFSSNYHVDALDYVYNLKTLGYTPIIAHAERVSYIYDKKTLKELKDNGALIQSSASVINGKHGNKEKKRLLKYIKLGLIDFIATDIHEKRISDIRLSYEIVSKKLGEEVAKKLFITNAEKYIIND